MKYWGSFFFVFLSFLANSQEKFSKEFRLITDNDLYVSISNDRYYTSGIFIEYSFLQKNNNPKLDKKIIDLSINHEIYTPINPTVPSRGQHDRPFAGLLYANLGVRNIYKENVIFGYSIQLGTIGEKSYAEELQQFIHRIYNFEEIVGWRYQIENALALNFRIDYITNLYTSENKKFDFGWMNTAKAGTILTNISSGFYGRFGFKTLQRLSNTLGFKTNLNDKTSEFFNESESFIYLKPMLRFAHYDATLQGSFLNKSSLVTKELNPFVFDFEVGFRYIKKRVNLGYSINYYSNKSKGLRTTEINKYGTITLGYLFN
jgi:hypothetical protein